MLDDRLISERLEQTASAPDVFAFETVAELAVAVAENGISSPGPSPASRALRFPSHDAVP
jgi:hypothetical protein